MGLLDHQGKEVGVNRGGRIDPLLDPAGRDVGVGPAGRLARTLRGRYVFEGIVAVKCFEDAYEATGKCFHCSGTVNAVLRFPAEEFAAGRVSDGEIRKRLYDMMQDRHQCGARLHDGKTLDTKWLEQFQ